MKREGKIEEHPGGNTNSMEDRKSAPEYFVCEQDVVIDKRMLKKGEKVYELTGRVDELIDTVMANSALHDEIVTKVSEISEKIAREMFPRIAERVIREEIEKLKRGTEEA